MATETDCKGCWWKEGDRCYVGKPPRDDRGLSLIIAEKRCDKFWDKRQALSQIIPDGKLWIASEGKPFPKDCKDGRGGGI